MGRARPLVIGATIAWAAAPYFAGAGAQAQDSEVFSAAMTSGLQKMSAANWSAANASFNAAYQAAAKIISQLTEDPNMTHAQFESASMYSNTASCFLMIASVRKATADGKYENTTKAPGFETLCSNILPQYASTSQRYQSEALAAIYQRRRRPVGQAHRSHTK